MESDTNQFIKFKKIFTDHLDHCYSVMRLKDSEHDFIVAASEENQPCYAYDLNDNYSRTTVWPNVGGTMTMVQIPGTLNFLATQRFYPGFNSAKCRIVKEIFNGHSWDQFLVRDFPYIHRFDIISHKNGFWFIGCSIANSKKNSDDWTDPGKIFIADYDDLTSSLHNIRALETRIIKNHGYRRVEKSNYSFITGESGIYKLHYPINENNWKLEQVSDKETSDIAFADINNDGKDEYLTIEGFHGRYYRISDNSFQTLYQNSGGSPFGHAIWGGIIGNKYYYIFGYRSDAKKLLLIDEENGKFNEQVIDTNVGPSNVLVFEKNGHLNLLSANREADEVAIYEITY